MFPPVFVGISSFLDQMKYEICHFTSIAALALHIAWHRHGTSILAGNKKTNFHANTTTIDRTEQSRVFQI